MSLQFTNYIEVFKKKNKGIFLFNKLNSTIVFIESNNYIAKQDNLYYIGNNNTDIAFLKEHDFFSFR